MQIGNVVEYIDRQKIMCGVVLEAKNQRLRLLTENNREVKLPAGRLIHSNGASLDVSMGRDRLVTTLKEIARRRNALREHVDLEELWEVLNTEQEWIDLDTMTVFCFPDNPTKDHESAVIRAFFSNRRYFKFNTDRFFPNSQEVVENIIAREKEEARIARLVADSGGWIKQALDRAISEVTPEMEGFIEILKSYYLLEAESPHARVARQIMAAGGIGDLDQIFKVLVNLGVWDENENLDLIRYEVPVEFSPRVIEAARELVAGKAGDAMESIRRDLTQLSIMTVDSQSTMDFDDAISVEREADHIRLGIHISDVGHYIAKDSPLDKEALVRASSIYTPDMKIPMLPAQLAEGLLSLRQGEIKRAVSLLVKMSPAGLVMDFEIVPSVIRVTRQLSYYDVNTMMDTDPDIQILGEMAQKFRQWRLSEGAVHITLPEIGIFMGYDGEITLSRTNRESPSRVLVSELMILANWLKARFLSDRGLPAVFRSQPGPRDRLYKADEGSLFQNWMQRKLISRVVLGHEAENHAGLGLNAYVTATSPIRKYFDLVTQRQIRAALGLEQPYTAHEIDAVLAAVKEPMFHVSRVQFQRNRYWLLKYLEPKVGGREEAIVLNRRRNGYAILIPAYMMECIIPPASVNLKPEDLIQVTIQQVNARKDVFIVFLG